MASKSSEKDTGLAADTNKLMNQCMEIGNKMKDEAIAASQVPWKSNAGELYTKTKLKSCSVSNEEKSMSMKVKFLFFSKTYRGKFQQNSTVGCEQFISMSEKINNLITSISCMVMNVRNNVLTSIKNNQNIRIVIDGNLNITNGAVFEITQSANLKLIQQNKISTMMAGAPSQQLSKGVIQAYRDLFNDANKKAQAIKQLAKNAKATEKFFSNLDSTLSSKDLSQSINEVSNDIENKINSSQDIEIRVGNNVDLDGAGTVIVGQDAFIQSTITNIVSNVITKFEDDPDVQNGFDMINALDQTIISKTDEKPIDKSKFIKELKVANKCPPLVCPKCESYYSKELLEPRKSDNNSLDSYMKIKKPVLYILISSVFLLYVMLIIIKLKFKISPLLKLYK